MGTRNLTMVVKDKEYKIAQYGQWDGYPEGQGLTALEFLETADLNKFRKVLDNVSFLDIDNMSEEEIKYIEDNFETKYNHLSRNHGAKILNIIYEEKATQLQNHISFAGDSLFCEWAYLIDLDKNTFEIYTGYNKEVVTSGRFLSSDEKLSKSDEFEPIVLLKSYNLNKLPDRDTFLADLKEDEDEDENS